MARSKKEVTNIVSGAGLLTRIFTDLDREVRALGGTDEDWHRLTTPAGTRHIKKMAKAMVSEFQIDDIKRMVIDYDRAIPEMVTAGQYDRLHNGLELTVPHLEDLSGKSGRMEVELVVFHGLDSMSAEYAREMMDQESIVSGYAKELLAYGEAVPDAQRKYRIVAPGHNKFNTALMVRYPVLEGNEQERAIETCLCDPRGLWAPHTRFLGVHTLGPVVK